MGDTDIQDAVYALLAKLVARDYAGVVVMTRGRRLSADEIGLAVTRYGRTLCDPPTPEALDMVRVASARSATWSIVCALWTVEEGRSDLCVELTAEGTPAGVRLELDNIHVP